MIKVAYIMQDFMIGGIPTFIYNLAKELSGRFEFHFLATDNPNIHPRFYEVGVALHTGNNWDYISQYLKENHIDIVQYGNRDEYRLCALKAKVPIIIERTAGPRSCNLPKDGITHVICSTKGTVNLVAQNYDGQLSAIYNGLDLKKYTNVVPDRLHFASDDFIVCYCARIGGVGQGFQFLIPAVIAARQKYKNIKLVLIGDRPANSAENILPELKKLAAPMGDDCVFTGALLDPTSVMAGCDVYVCPALHHGISNSIIEACALNKPIIATGVGQTNEIVHDTRNGYLVPARNISAITKYIIDLHDNSATRIDFGEYGRALVEKEFNIKYQADKYAELYMKLVSEAQLKQK